MRDSLLPFGYAYCVPGLYRLFPHTGCPSIANGVNKMIYIYAISTFVNFITSKLKLKFIAEICRNILLGFPT